MQAFEIHLKSAPIEGILRPMIGFVIAGVQLFIIVFLLQLTVLPTVGRSEVFPCRKFVVDIELGLNGVPGTVPAIWDHIFNI